VLVILGIAIYVAAAPRTARTSSTLAGSTRMETVDGAISASSQVAAASRPMSSWTTSCSSPAPMLTRSTS